MKLRIASTAIIALLALSACQPTVPGVPVPTIPTQPTTPTTAAPVVTNVQEIKCGTNSKDEATVTESYFKISRVSSEVFQLTTIKKVKSADIGIWENNSRTSIANTLGQQTKDLNANESLILNNKNMLNEDRTMSIYLEFDSEDQTDPITIFNVSIHSTELTVKFNGQYGELGSTLDLDHKSVSTYVYTGLNYGPETYRTYYAENGLVPLTYFKYQHIEGLAHGNTPSGWIGNSASLSKTSTFGTFSVSLFEQNEPYRILSKGCESSLRLSE